MFCTVNYMFAFFLQIYLRKISWTILYFHTSSSEATCSTLVAAHRGDKYTEDALCQLGRPGEKEGEPCRTNGRTRTSPSFPPGRASWQRRSLEANWRKFSRGKEESFSSSRRTNSCKAYRVWHLPISKLLPRHIVNDSSKPLRTGIQSTIDAERASGNDFIIARFLGILLHIFVHCSISDLFGEKRCDHSVFPPLL